MSQTLEFLKKYVAPAGTAESHIVARARTWSLVGGLWVIALFTYGTFSYLREWRVEAYALEIGRKIRPELTPMVQDLGAGQTLSSAAAQSINAFLQESEFGQRCITFKLWKRGGVIVYGNRSDLVGREMPPSKNLRKAWLGEIRAEFDELDEIENKFERALQQHILEFYLPLLAQNGERVIAVAEFYVAADDLERDLQLLSVAIVLAGALCGVGLIFGTLYVWRPANA